MLLAADAARGQPVTPDLSAELRVVQSVLQNPAMQKAMRYVEGSEAETVREWIGICNAYGPQGDEIYRSRHLYKLFRMYGLERVHIDDQRNVIGVRPGVGQGPTVVLNSHHDNVALWPKDQPVEAFVADGRVWCPAARDALMGITQMLTVLRALNAADIQTQGDIWFVGFTGEEVGSPGVEHFVRANYPHNLDWRRGDIIAQLHGGGGEGVTTGSEDYIHFTQLRVFTALDFNRWQVHAVDALGKILARITDEVRDPQAIGDSREFTRASLPREPLFLNPSMLQASAIHNSGADEAWVRFDMRAPSEERLWQAHRDITHIAEEVVAEMGDGFSYHYSINMKLGTPGLEGWDKVNNAPARYAAAAARALYGVPGTIDPSSGCGDCRRAFMMGMPAMSFRGNVIDQGGGRFEIRDGRRSRDTSIRRKSAGHDVTESAAIEELWAGVKHALLFAVSYAGLAR